MHYLKTAWEIQPKVLFLGRLFVERKKISQACKSFLVFHIKSIFSLMLYLRVNHSPILYYTAANRYCT